jgi:hypothetical protein
MTRRRIAVALVGITFVVAAAASGRGADGEKKSVAKASSGADKEESKDKDKDKDEGKDKGKEKDKGKKEEPKPACMHCGATCGLEPVCVCEPGTKKKPKVEFEVTCEPICVAGCGSKPWPFGRWHDRGGCTSCCAEPCACRGWVRNRKKLKRETTDEEVPAIKRTVAYVCATRCSEPCKPRSSSWWSLLTAWCRCP